MIVLIIWRGTPKAVSCKGQCSGAAGLGHAGHGEAAALSAATSAGAQGKSKGLGV